MPFTEGHQSPGNPIPSAGWNTMVDEIKRLGSAKLDVAGGAITGPLSVQQSLAVTGAAAAGNTTVNGSLSATGPTNLGSTLSVNGAFSTAGTASVAGTATLGSARVGPGGGGAPQDSLDVAGFMRVGSGDTQLRFTHTQSQAFPDNAQARAEICNDTTGFKRLMIVGNRSNPRPNTPRMVGMWDVVTIGSDGTTNGRLEVNGQSCARSFCNLSDVRLKTDVAPLADPLGRLTRLRGVSFRWTPDGASGLGARGSGVASGSAGAPDSGVPSGSGSAPGSPGAPSTDTPASAPSIGVVAQEVAEVFPELISTIGDAEHLGVDYGGLTAVLVEAVKQLAASNDELRRRVAVLEAGRAPAA